MEMRRVLIVGCGQLGSRHLQAVATLPQVKEIEVVDPRPEALELGKTRLLEATDRQPSITVQWYTSLHDATPGGALCIVATHADVRPQLVRDVAESLGYTAFLVEKLVAQSVQEYERLMQEATAKRWAVWVNCKTRAHPSHRRVKARLRPEEPIFLSVMGGNHGLANNGIHAADLFVFYDGASQIECAGSTIDPIVHQTNRGLFDLSGTLHGSSARGSRFTLSFAQHQGPVHFTVVSPSYRAIVDDMLQWFWESTPQDGWAWRQVPFQANMTVSHMTRQFASEILSRSHCELPTLQECYPAHRFILEQLQPHFALLLGVEQACPVT